jgi:hypothetical protein
MPEPVKIACLPNALQGFDGNQAVSSYNNLLVRHVKNNESAGFDLGKCWSQSKAQGNAKTNQSFCNSCVHLNPTGYVTLVLTQNRVPDMDRRASAQESTTSLLFGDKDPCNLEKEPSAEP